MPTSRVQIDGATSAGAHDVDQPPEVRRQMRYPLRAHVAFEWAGRDGAHHGGKGYSRDVSERGAYVLARTYPSVGASIRLEIRFPYRWDPVRANQIVMDGRVVRVEFLLGGKSNWGFAVESVHTVLHEFGGSGGGPTNE
jgi:hypothetical protein